MTRSSPPPDGGAGRARRGWVAPRSSAHDGQVDLERWCRSPGSLYTGSAPAPASRCRRPSPGPGRCPCRSLVVKNGSNTRGAVSRPCRCRCRSPSSRTYGPGASPPARAAPAPRADVGGLDRQRPAGRHRVAGVDREVEHHLLQLPGSAITRWSRARRSITSATSSPISRPIIGACRRRRRRGPRSAAGAPPATNARSWRVIAAVRIRGAPDQLEVLRGTSAESWTTRSRDRTQLPRARPSSGYWSRGPPHRPVDRSTPSAPRAATAAPACHRSSTSVSVPIHSRTATVPALTHRCAARREVAIGRLKAQAPDAGLPARREGAGWSRARVIDGPEQRRDRQAWMALTQPKIAILLSRLAGILLP